MEPALSGHLYGSGAELSSYHVSCTFYMQGKFRPGKLEVRNEEPAVLESEFGPLMSGSFRVSENAQLSELFSHL